MWLEVLSGEDAGRVVEIAEPLVLGRVQGAGLVIRDARASRRHASLTPEGDGVRLHDLGSVNGTLVDGAPVEDALLGGGEEVRIGDVRIAVLSEEPPATGTPGPPRVHVETEGPSWSFVGRLQTRSRRTRRRLLGALAVAAVALVALAAVLATSRTEDERVADAIRTAGPATVRVEARSHGVRSGLGSGWVLDAGQGLVVTAAHVINRGELFYVGDTVTQVAGVAPCEDVALLRREGGVSTPSLSFGHGARGDTVVALGYPQTAEAGDPATATRGIVAADHARLPDPSAELPSFPHALQSDTVLDPGFSGGPLVDLDGHVAGVDVAFRGRRAYAIAPERARAVLDELRAGRSSGWMGARFDFPSAADVAGYGYPSGLWIGGVIPGSGAERAGLHDGDYVFSVDGRPVGTTLSGWCAAAGDVRTGQLARLGVIREGRRRETVPVRFD